jgi:DNA polymerase elongation subunit (family B)
MVKHIILVQDEHDIKHKGTGVLIGMSDKVELSLVATELDLIQKFVDLVHYYNPDILMAYDMLYASLGFINRRWNMVYNLDILNMISRIPYVTKFDKKPCLFYKGRMKYNEQDYAAELNEK